MATGRAVPIKGLHQSASPTVQLYFAWSMADAIRDQAIEFLSATVLKHEATLIVFRHLSGLRRLPKHDRLIYVLDDDWRAGLRDPFVPAKYRATLALREGLSARRLETSADLILLSSQTLLDRYSERYKRRRLALLEPVWPEANAPLANPRPTKLAYLSAATHKRDFQFLQPVLKRLIQETDVHLTISENAPIPDEWSNASNVNIVPVLNWQDYHEWMAEKSFDLLLYPSIDSPFNTARSRNKLLETDQFGAALVASQSWRPGREAAVENRCLALPNEEGAWFEGISDLIRQRNAANSCASANRRWILSEDLLKKQSLLWRAVLSGDSPQSGQ